MMTVEQALARVEAGLRDGLYVHVVMQELGGGQVMFDVPVRGAGARFFNMEYWSEKTDCGAVCCIGGWLETELGRRLTDQEHSTYGELFHPDADPVVWKAITPTQAAAAIANWRESCDARWRTVLGLEEGA